MIYLGGFDSEEEAARKYDAHAKSTGSCRKINFPEEPVQEKTKERRKSKFKGVSWNFAAQKWVAQIRSGGKQEYLGSFSEESLASQAYEKAATALGRTITQLLGDDEEPSPVKQANGLHENGSGESHGKLGEKKSTKFRGIHWSLAARKVRHDLIGKQF